MLWTPDPGRDERQIVYMVDRKRWMIGGVVIVLGVAFFIPAFAGQVTILLLIVGGAICMAGFRYAFGGNGGYYEVADDGGLGDFIDHSRPDVSWMKLTRVT